MSKDNKKKNEKLWNEDLIETLHKDLLKSNQKIKIKKGKVLRDIFLKLTNDKNYKLQLGFLDQDIIIYTDTMDISDLYKIKNITIHNIDKDNKNEICIPIVICELKYDGINTHGLITYSDIASDVKSIFPLCKYILLLRYRNNSSSDKLLRNGKTFDNILCFDDGKAPKRIYKKGDFQKKLKNNEELKSKYDALLKYLKDNIKESKTYFLK